jgi:hypothetical protein
MLYTLPYLLFMRLHRAALDARRRDRTWRYFAWSGVAGILGSLLVALTVSTAWMLWVIGWWPLALAMIALFAVPVAQPVLQRHVLVRLGAVRCAYWLGHLVTMRDSDAYGLACAAWALTGRPTPASEAWLIARRDRRRPLGDAEIVVTALVAAARGDADTARELLRSVDSIVEVHPAVREIAGEWLACDAAERRAWAELAADATAARWPATSLSYFLEGLAARRAGLANAPGARELYARWLLAPYRRATLALLREQPAAQPHEPDTSALAPELDRTAAPLPRAVAAHLAVATAPPGRGQLAEAVHAWDIALADASVQAWLAHRALELGAPSGASDRALRELANAVTDELARIAEHHAVPADAPRGRVGDALARKLRHGRLDALEASFTRWAEHRHSGTARAPIDEWREWCALRSAYETATMAGGRELRRLAFPHAYTTGTQMAAWLWNSRKEYALSYAISKWLLGEAIAVGDSEAIDLCTRNTRLAVPTRTGTVQPGFG